MNAETFCEHFQSFADAPNGVEKLRGLILQLAIQGRLVEQNHNEATASVLIELARKASHESNASSKRKPNSSTLNFGDQSGECPSGWVWTTLGEMGAISPRNVLSDDTEVSFLPMASTSTVYSAPLQPETRTWGEVKKGFTHLADGDVAMAKITPCFQNGKTTVMQGLTNGHGAGTTELHILRPYPNCLIPEYAVIFLRTPQFVEQNVSRMSGSAGQQRVPKEHFAESPFPLPPLAEQRRIVEKVDQLLGLCDELAARQAAQREKRQRLVGATLDRLVTCRDPAEFPAHTHRLRNHFDRLFDTPTTIPQLRQTILQLAVQGKLVPQDPNYERATNLSVPDEELFARSSFEIPHGWTWTRLSQLADINGGFAFKSTDYTDEGIRVVRISDFDEFGFNDHKVVRHSFTPDLQRFSLAQSNILMAMTGGTVGKSYLVKSLPEPMIVNQRVATIKLLEGANPNYVEIVIRSEMTQQIIRKAKNSTNDNISIGDIKGFAIPVPPLAAQKRIVTKVTELLSLCDALEAKLTQAESASTQLLSAAVHSLLTIST